MRVAHLGTQMMAVQVDDRLVHDQAQPDKHRKRFMLDKIGNPLSSRNPRILQDIVGIDPSRNDWIQPELDHSPQAGALACECRRKNGLRIPFQLFAKQSRVVGRLAHDLY